MPYPFHVKYGFFLLICLTVFFVFCFPSQTKAEFAPGIFVTEVKINQVSGNEIKGEFTVVNSEDYYLSDLNYEIKLFQGTSFKQYKLIDASVLKETFFVPPKETITKSFDYTYPKNIISGGYALRVVIISAGIGEMGWKDQIVSLNGQNKFLEMFPPLSKVLAGNKEYWTLEGANVSPGEKVTGSLQVKNPGDEIIVVPDIKIFKRQVDMPLVEEYQGSPITFAKGETKQIQLEMPNFDIPESYLAEVKFYQNQEQISGTEYFRWVVKGEGGKILDVKANKDYYRAGENMELTIESVGPADTSDLGQGKLEIAVSDKNGNLVAKTSKDVPLNSDTFSSTIAIPVKSDLVSPEIEVALTKDGKILDDRKIGLPVFSAGAKQLENQLAKKAETPKYLLYLIILAIILVVGFLIYRFRKKISAQIL